jgi:hypothetical protein
LRLPLLFFLPRGGILLLRELGSHPTGIRVFRRGSVYAIERGAMMKKNSRVPPERGVPRTPRGNPLAQPRLPEPVAAAPPERGIAARPNPRRPRVVRDVHGNELMDLFEFFPDLPRPPRRRARLSVRRVAAPAVTRASRPGVSAQPVPYARRHRGSPR